MIAEIRSHIKSCIKDCSTKYVEINKPYLADEDVTEDKIDYKYFAGIGVVSDEINGADGNVSDVNVVLRTYVQGGRDLNASFDEGLTQAMIIKQLILDISKLINKQYIKSINSSDVNPVEVLDSEHIYSYETNFIFKISYGLGE